VNYTKYRSNQVSKKVFILLNRTRVLNYKPGLPEKDMVKMLMNTLEGCRTELEDA